MCPTRLTPTPQPVCPCPLALPKPCAATVLRPATGLWQDELDNTLKPAHPGLAQADDDVHSLAVSIAGLGFMLHVGSDVMSALCPSLVATPAGIDRYAERLLAYAQARVASEASRRATLAASARPNPRTCA